MDPLDTVRERLSRGTGPLGLAVATLVILVAAPPAAAQVEEGISIGLTPTAEHVFWSDDLRLDDETYWGAEGSLNFGRFVSLQAHYLWGDDVDAAEVGPLETRRFGGDVVFTFAETSLTPFLKAGAGVAEFEADGAEDEFLTGRIGGGIRFDIFERLQTQVFVQDLMVRAAPDATIVAPGQVDEDGVQTIHNLGIGAGVNFYLGGQRDLPATDRVFRGLQGFSVPVEFFAGSLVFDNALGLNDETVAGARLGLDFGSYVGLRGYYFGSTEGDFDGFTDYFGYGAEGQFNLTRSDETITPFLTLGAGRLHFPDDLVEQARLDDDKEWTASFGGGVAFNVTERLRAELGARDLVMTAGAPEDVADPDQLQSNWLFTGGLKFAVGGETPDPRVRPEDDRPAFPRVEGEPDGEERLPGQVAERDREMQDVEGEDELRREVLALRQEMDALRMDLRLLAMGERAPMGRMDRMGPMARTDTADEVMARTQARDREIVEVPVLEDGEIYIRFGESGTFERMSTEQLALLAELSREEGVTLGELRREALPPAAAGGGAARADRLDRELERLRAEVEALRRAPAATEAERPDAEAERPDTETERPDTETERPDTETERPEAETERPEAQAERPRGEGAMRMDSLLQAIRGLQAEIDSLRDERAREAMERPPETRQRLPEVERLERRVRDLEAELERTRREDRPRREAEERPVEPRPEAERPPEERERERAPEAEVEVEPEPDVEAEPDVETEPEVEADAERGVLEGGRARFRGISPYTGASLHEPNQLLLGVQADIGSAFGGSARLVPEFNVGVTDEFTWNVNAHIEWPLPFDFEEAEPYVGAGLGLLEADGMELLIPNVVAGASYPLGDYQVFGALHGLDFFDETRLLFGLRTQPPAFLRSDGQR